MNEAGKRTCKRKKDFRREIKYYGKGIATSEERKLCVQRICQKV